ncbi:stalk domain-containing protein [Paenibacillus macquariensis]|uniref:Copper amine oxidase N-terminal domain-containing protein n=1 Tax=Paenibacillus macquariensis TaxID=948756 RepID=A0ABY1K7G0_9BACL|nr:stalk domain-containing protein [Paenibacillus macquariensis]MEC0091070.1 stalk domain-containing protein [Paenibacillus macquariensis]OAB33741.1 hypothetical protein PMSM_14065 [Paenibacillus macquariensis subsp. macquariensis]SIR36886.1 Copper amine oxidase N-terminal domain-containing protein [Paenibacillus macquariensis]
MKTRKSIRISTTLLITIAITAVLVTNQGQVHAQATSVVSPTTTTTKTIPTVEIVPNTWEYDTKHTSNDFFIKNGTAYLSYKQASEMFRDLVWSYDQKTGYLNVSGPNRTLSWKVSSKTATLNGKSRLMSAPLLQRNGDINLPLRDLLSWSGGSIKSNNTNKITVSYPILHALSGDAKGWYWVRKDNGIVYTAVGSQMPHNIGQSAVRAIEYADMSVIHVDISSSVLQVNYNHGEPHLGNDIYKLYIYNGKLVKESHVSYYGGSQVESIDEANGLTVMLNGSDLLLIRSNGTVEQKYDLKKLGKLDEEYTVEYASSKDGILLIRPYESQTLLFIDSKLDAPVVLYKELLSKEDQKLFDEADKSVFMPLSDGLQFVKRDGDTFTFKHTQLFNKGTEELTYTLTR